MLEEVKFNQKKVTLNMKKSQSLSAGTYSISGWWKSLDCESAAFVRDRGEVPPVGVVDQKPLWGIVVIKSNGTIDSERSVIWDAKGCPAPVRSGESQKQKKMLHFIRRPTSSADDISYVVCHNPKTDCWSGKFEGDMVGEGVVKIAFRKLPNTLFVDDLPHAL
jgi:hypothetical protein